MKITTLDLTNSSQNNIDISCVANILEHDKNGAEMLLQQESIPTDSVWLKYESKEK